MAVDKKNIVSIRLSDHEFEPFAKVMKELNVGKTEFFRALILSRFDNVVVPEKRNKATPDFKRCLFYFNKSSNNLNQIAYRLNKENLNGIISDSLVKKCLLELVNIRELLQGALKK